MRACPLIDHIEPADFEKTKRHAGAGQHTGGKGRGNGAVSVPRDHEFPYSEGRGYFHGGSCGRRRQDLREDNTTVVPVHDLTHGLSKRQSTVELIVHVPPINFPFRKV